MTTRDYETIRQQVHGITRGKGRLPGAWWVGTDKTLPLRDDLLKHRQRDKDDWGRLADMVHADPDKIWTLRRILVGFTPMDPDNPHKALRPDRNIPGIWVPNRRSKAGKELAQAIEEHNRNRAPDGLPGFTGDIRRHMGDTWTTPHFVVGEGMYPVVTLAEDPDNTGVEKFGFTGPLTIDTELWERMPLSWLARIVEETEANG